MILYCFIFIQIVSGISKNAISSGEESKSAQGASVPSLGLSNKAVFEDESSIPESDRHVKDNMPGKSKNSKFLVFYETYRAIV